MILRRDGRRRCTKRRRGNWSIAVEAFLSGELSFPGIAAVVEDTLNAVPTVEAGSVGEVLEMDRQSREAAKGIVRKRSRKLAGMYV